ncbi:MAG TPA: zinc metallopeptidase [Victivallis vadensis]|nr:zinc metallopeptidase [Victivallis vadensis]
MYFDPVYFLFLLPGLLLAAWASCKTKTTFDRYSEVTTAAGMTGAQAAARLLADAGIRDVRIEEVGGFLSDHYDPANRMLRLSPSVYGSNSIAAIGVACHEAGHAIQHATSYGPLGMRSALVPVVNFSSPVSYILMVLGFILAAPGMIWLGVILFSMAVLFTLVTLPVEYDASRRAKLLMVEAGIVTPHEERAAAEVLNAAFLTYVASAVSALLTLLYYLYRLGVFSRRD